ncbi:MAG: hypothetical protein QOE05_3001 [Actinomycetota bacterium]|nr:hypothetical protein [Actinomycetota bacterium]
MCVRRGRREAGSIELLQYPVASLTAAAAALRSGGPEAALRAHAEDFLRSLAADRKAGCGADYQLTPLPFEILRPADGPVLHYGFVAGRPGGPVLERVEHFEGLRAADKVLVLVHASATAVAGCLDREGEFLPADLSALAPVLTALVVRNGLPTPLAG